MQKGFIGNDGDGNGKEGGEDKEGVGKAGGGICNM